MHILTFQSKDVLDILLKDKIYFADKTKAREGAFSLEDYNRYRCYPVWCYSGLADTIFQQIDSHRRELSSTAKMFDTVYLYEIVVPNMNIPMSYSHNINYRVVIIPYIDYKMLRAIYEIKYISYGNYEITTIKILGECLFHEKTYTLDKDENEIEFTQQQKDMFNIVNLESFDKNKFDKLAYAQHLDDIEIELYKQKIYLYKGSYEITDGGIIYNYFDDILFANENNKTILQVSKSERSEFYYELQQIQKKLTKSSSAIEEMNNI